jgi:hypothetical protein
MDFLKVETLSGGTFGRQRDASLHPFTFGTLIDVSG